MPDADDSLMPSLYDRLADPAFSGLGWRRSYTIDQLMQSVRRDLEDLLNSHQPPRDLLAGFPEAQRSVMGYGLPDYHSYSQLDVAERDAMAERIRQAVALYEPRLADVDVAVRTPDQVREKFGPKAVSTTALYFHIRGTLKADPFPRIDFDTVLELTRGRHEVRA